MNYIKDKLYCYFSWNKYFLRYIKEIGDSYYFRIEFKTDPKGRAIGDIIAPLKQDFVLRGIDELEKPERKEIIRIMFGDLKIE